MKDRIICTTVLMDKNPLVGKRKELGKLTAGDEIFVLDHDNENALVIFNRTLTGASVQGIVPLTSLESRSNFKLG